MKKLFLYVFLSLLWCNVSVAEAYEPPEYHGASLNANIIKYKWKQTGSYNQGTARVIILKKGQWILNCALFVKATKCWMP